jgi:hypothetical protein
MVATSVPLLVLGSMIIPPSPPCASSGSAKPVRRTKHSMKIDNLVQRNMIDLLKHTNLTGAEESAGYGRMLCSLSYMNDQIN